MMAFIDQLGVNNIIVEAREATDRDTLQVVRTISPGLTFRDFRAISENVPGLEAITPRKRFKPSKVLPKTAAEIPGLIGVLPNYEQINSLKMDEGRFFSEEENNASASVCVLGETAKVNLLGYDPALKLPHGVQVVDGPDECRKAVREQIGKRVIDQARLGPITWWSRPSTRSCGASRTPPAICGTKSTACT